MIQKLPSNMLHLIIEYLATNKELLSCRYTSKFLKKFTDKNGFLKKIILSMNSSIGNLLYLSRPKIYYLSTIEFKCLKNPLQMFPTKWKKKMIFYHCSFTMPIIPNKNNNTEMLWIKDYNRLFNKKPLKIDWSLLPNLKLLNIYSWDINFTGIQNCKKLETIIIDIGCPKKDLPDVIYTLPNIITCKIIIDFHKKRYLNFKTNTMHVKLKKGSALLTNKIKY